MKFLKRILLFALLFGAIAAPSLAYPSVNYVGGLSRGYADSIYFKKAGDSATGKGTFEAGIDLVGTLRLGTTEGTYLGGISIEGGGSMYHDITVANEEFVFDNTGSGASGIVRIKGGGAAAGTGILRCNDEDDAEYVTMYASSGQGYIKTDGSSPGQLNLQADVKGDVECFDLTDVADGADGKIFRVNRKAEEGDKQIDLYVNNAQQATIYSDAAVVMSAESFRVDNDVNITGTTTTDGLYWDNAFGNTITPRGANLSIIGSVEPNADDTFDLGAVNEWRNANFDGTVNIDSLVADTADINGGTVDGISSLTSSGDLDIGAHGFRSNTLTADGLTAGRLIVAGASGLLSDATVTESSGALGGITTLTASATVSGGTLTDGTAIITGGAASGITTLTASETIEGGALTDGTALIASGAASGVTTLDMSGDLTAGGNVFVAGTLEVSATIESTSGGFKFPDDTIQTTAVDQSLAVLKAGSTSTGTQTVEVDVHLATNSGMVGIGTDEPSATLDVDGTFQATGSGTFEGNLRVNGDISGDGSTDIGGMFYVGGTYCTITYCDTHWQPSNDTNKNLGAAARRWANFWVRGNSQFSGTVATRYGQLSHSGTAEGTGEFNIESSSGGITLTPSNESNLVTIKSLLLISPEATCPITSGTAEGTIWYDAPNHMPKIWDTTQWVDMI